MNRRLRARSALTLFLLPLLCLGSGQDVHAGRGVWTTAGPEGGVIRSLAVDPGISGSGVVYSGTESSGVFKSSTGGNFWTPIGLDSEGPVLALVIAPRTPTTLYAGTSYGRVFKSTDGGASWSTGIIPRIQVMFALTLDPQTPTTLYAGADTGGDEPGGPVLKSTDGGTTWRSSSVGLPTDRSITALAIDPTAPATLYAGGAGLRGGVFKSTDGGAAWTDSSAGLPKENIAILAVDPLTPSIVYAVAAESGIFKSSNGGGTWTPSNVGLPSPPTVSALAIDPQTPATLYAGTAATGVFKSTNGGSTWIAANAGLRDDRIRALAVDARTPATVYVGGSRLFREDGPSLFKSLDGGDSWNPSATGITGFSLSTLAIDPQRPVTLYAGTDRGLFKSTDAGASWNASDLGLSDKFVVALVIDPQTPDVVYAGTGSGVFKSTDGGVSWRESSTGLPFFSFSVFLPPNVRELAIVPETPMVLYALVDALGVFKSTDGGATWNKTLSDIRASTVVVVGGTPATVYVGTRGGGIFKSTNGGATWTPENAGFKNLEVLGLAVDPAGTCLHAGTNTGAFSFATRVDATCLPPPPLVATLSTTSQSVEVGTPARTFASVQNVSGLPAGSAPDAAADGVAGVTCGITQLTGAPTPFTFQAVDPTTNQPVAPLNTPVDIAPASSQKFLVTLTPSASVCPTNIQLGFNCTNTGVADIITGQNTLLLTAGSPAGCGLSASASANQSSFLVGQTLIAGGSVANPGLPGMTADFYVGVLRPDGSIQFVTPDGIVVGSLGDLRSFQPLAMNAPLTTPFTVSQSSVFTHQWSADDLRGPYVFFVLAVKAGALAGGTGAGDHILALASASYAFR